MANYFRWILVWLLALPLPLAFGQSFRLEGVVRDSTGASVANAVVIVQSREFTARKGTDPQGAFVFPGVPYPTGTVEVQARGFAVLRQSWDMSGPSSTPLELVLRPAPVEEQVVVSAAGTGIRLSEAPGSSVLLSDSDLKSAPALALDDILRQVPGFSLFRRYGSTFANPTTLGVSLRGMGASGASRALVMEDGIPLLDPFGGWVYWDRVPEAAISSVEIFRGGDSSLYGSSALGGVIQMFTRQPTGPAISVETSYGNEQTPDLSLWAGERIGHWDTELETDLSRTDGYFLVPSSLRGSIDTPVNSAHATIGAGVGYHWGENGRLYARGSYFEDSRNNGTPIQTNQINLGRGAVGLDTGLGPAGSLAVRLYGDVEGYDQNFSSVAAGRNSESLTDLQHVPAQDTGGNAQWTRALGKNQTLLAGVDFQQIIGSSDERLFSSGAQTFTSVSGGRQHKLGFFGEDILRIHQKWTVILGVRGDDWRNYNAALFRTPVSSPGPTVATDFASRSESAFSPRLAVLRSLTQNISVTASGYRAFRAPTLNELYRSFRQGSIVTNDNPALRAEHLTGAEAGIKISEFAHKLDLRGTYFWSQIVDPVANVTLTTTPTLITRQRQNLGRTQSQGVELDGVFHLSKSIEMSGGYAFTDATVVSFPAETSLQGLEVPQVPRQQFTVEARYWNPARLMLTVQGRFAGTQYDDDQNQLPLGHFFTVDLMAGRSLGHGLEVFAAAENLFDQSYLVARTPTPNQGPPTLFRVGLRFDLPAR